MNAATLLDELKQQQVKLWVEGENLRVQMPKGAVTPALRSLITQHKADLLAWLKQSEQDASLTLAPIQVNLADRYQPFPLTDIQQAYWIGRNGALALGDVSTHGYLEFLYTHLDVERLTVALNKLITRHEMLRAVILPSGQQQILASVEPYQIFVLDLRGSSVIEQEEQLAAIRQEMSHQVLPYDKAPLFDIRVTYLSNHQLLLHISFDLLMCDVGSLYILFDEWRRLYESSNLLLAPLEFSFRDYVLAEEAANTTPTYQAARTYWLKRLSDFAPAPELPLAQMPSALTQQIFHRRSHQISPTTWQSLKSQAQQLGISPSVLQLTLFATTLKSWSKQPRFTLNLTLFNRPPLHEDIKRLVGDFTSLILVDVDYTTPLSLAEQSKRLQFQLWEAIEHRHFSGIEVMREISRQQNNPQAGLMPIVFTSAIGVGEADGASLFDLFHGELRYIISQTPQVWLDHQIFEYQGGLLLNWDSVDALFPPAMLDDMFTSYCDLIERLARDESLWNDADLTLLPSVQASQYHITNTTATPVGAELLPTGFLYQVQERPTAPAIITPERTLSYQELYQYANQIGHWLRAQGAKPNQLVAIVMEKGWEQVAAVLGIHLAGAAYLPIDPSLPTERQHYLLQQGEVTIALTQQQYATQLTWPQVIQHFVIDKMHVDQTLPPLTLIQKSTDIAYVIYTSGSTGLPKGVIIDHRGAVNTILDINQRFGVSNQDRVLALSALNFDLSVYDIFGLLAVGGAIVFPSAHLRTDPEHWFELMQRHDVTLWDTVPALMQMLVDQAEAQQQQAGSLPSALRLVMMSGDWIPVTLPDRIYALWPNVTMYSLGGATEASIWSIYYPITKVEATWTSIPYGKPMRNQTFYVFDSHLNLRPHWVPGDLYIGGIGLAIGYWKDAQKSNERFVIHPRTGERLYKTGDLGRYLPDGNIEFLGREDFQVKIRGHRIELGEIESMLLQSPLINEAVVNAVGDPKGQRQLVAYVILKPEQPPAELPAQTNTMHDQDNLHTEIEGVAIHDHIERLTFKLKQSGIRPIDGERLLALPKPLADEALQARFLARQSYRTFCPEAIPLQKFSEFLSCLMQLQLPHTPLPKYLYPSAGGLYPIQCYLYVKAERITGLPGGFYYYHPRTHQLVWLNEDDAAVARLYPAANQAIFEQAGFVLFLIAAEDAIQPLYGEWTTNFCLLEAGYMSQLLMMEASTFDLGLCPTGVSEAHLLHTLCKLNKDHRLVHSLVGGMIDPAQKRHWLQNATEPQQRSPQKPQSVAWQKQLQRYLTERLPSYMVPVHYIALEALPLSANGKVDRKALPLPTLNEPTERVIPPTTELEMHINEALQEMLATATAPRVVVSVEQSFAELGLSSVHIVRFNNLLKTRLNREIPIAALFQYPTIRSLADYLQQVETQKSKERTSQFAANTRAQQRVQARLAHRQPPRR